MLPESSSQGHLFIKVRNCCLNPFIAANVTQAAVMDSGWGCDTNTDVALLASDTNVGTPEPSWVGANTAWGCAKFPWHCQGQSWLLPRSNSSSFSLKELLSPLVSGSGHPREEFAHPVLCVMAQREGGSV